MAVVVKNLPTNAGDLRDTGSIPGSGRSPGEGNGNPLQYSCLGNPKNRQAWWAIELGSRRVGHDWSDLAHTHAFFKLRCIHWGLTQLIDNINRTIIRSEKQKMYVTHFTAILALLSWSGTKPTISPGMPVHFPATTAVTLGSVIDFRSVLWDRRDTCHSQTGP